MEMFSFITTVIVTFLMGCGTAILAILLNQIINSGRWVTITTLVSGVLGALVGLWLCRMIEQLPS